MTCIWKFLIPFDNPGLFELDMPKGAKLLTVQVQNSQPMLWAEVKTIAPPVKRKLVIVGTGTQYHPKSSYKYVATWQEPPYVWHLLDRGE